MGFKPLADNVLIKLASAETVTKGGIYIPSTAKEDPNYGDVVSVGSGTLIKNGTKIPIEVNEGDKVVFKKGAGVPMDIDGEDYVVVREYEILGVV